MTRRGSSSLIVVALTATTLLIASSLSTLPTALALSKVTPAAPGQPVANNTVTRIQSWLENQVSVSFWRSWKSGEEENCFFFFTIEAAMMMEGLAN